MLAFNKADEDVHKFLYRYYKEAIRCGITIEDKFQNPTVEQNTYLNNILSNSFQVNAEFLRIQLEKWIQGLTPNQTQTISNAIYSVFMDLRAKGKNDSALHNAYTKFMCWLYYRLRSVLSQIGTGKLPRIMYEGDITPYELYMLKVMNRCGCDVLILSSNFSEKIASDSMLPQIWQCNTNTCKFDGTFIKNLKKEYLLEQKLGNVCGPESTFVLCRNAWLDKIEPKEICRRGRSASSNMICTALLKFSGVEDRNCYQSDLFKLYSDVCKDNRQTFVLNNGIPAPTAQEISAIKRIPIKNDVDLIVEAINNINTMGFNNEQFKQHVKHTIKDVVFNLPGELRKREETVIKILAILNRYNECMSHESIACMFVLEKSPITDFEYLCYDILSRISLDVVIFNPEKLASNVPSEIVTATFENTLKLKEFPTEQITAAYSTTAYNAMKDYSDMMYHDTSLGIYKDRQFNTATPVALKTMYEEIEVLWLAEVNAREGFEVTDESVILPTIFAKVCGVKDGNKKNYAKNIEKLVRGRDNVLFWQNKIPYNFEPRPEYSKTELLWGKDVFARPNTKGYQINIASVLTNGHIDVKKTRDCPLFKYNYLRNETVEYMIEKLDILLNGNIIDGMKKNGAENNLMKVFFNLPNDVIRLIQKFDFTKENPKVVYLNTSESILTLDETIFLHYLFLLGFDIVVFVPTGYNTIEKFITKKMFTEHQIGEYMYNLQLDIKRKKGLF